MNLATNIRLGCIKSWYTKEENKKNNRPKKISAHIFAGIVFNSYYCKNYQRQFRYYYTVLEQLFLKMKIVKIWFDSEFIYGVDDTGKEYRQSLLWYPKLQEANNEQRQNYTFGFVGIHWRELNEDVSFESFLYADAVPSELQAFFLSHKEINVAEFAKRIGINPTLLRNYINGFKTPSEQRTEAIKKGIKELGMELLNAF